ncbi:hypothetical protein [[Limnothrix rosea] IAM M-220]|uniref:hypothetical protein n=1 Tax=[Limnothrix rosea] IAM M-220 TaxID=454133 RepID=UPI0009672F9D|nr:hypothetical protein [[Limnothrix rosea] IAM M-220]OKH17902.1 hypothetical protein NIES208_07870 [[Limnothrix rosea] IAM M-220]
MAEIESLNQAKQKLNEESLPLSKRAISYIRICSVVMQILAKDLEEKMPESYSTILSALYSLDIYWWRDCYVDPAGFLQSKNTKVQSLLKPINDFAHQVLR